MHNEQKGGNKLVKRNNQANTPKTIEIIVSLRGNNQELIVLAHNPIFYSKIKHINILYYYIHDKMGIEKIKFFYRLIN